MIPFPPHNWHNSFTADRELILIRWCVQHIDPTQPVAVSGYNAFVVIKKMAFELSLLESEHKQVLSIELPDGSTVADLFEAWKKTSLPKGNDL